MRVLFISNRFPQRSLRGDQLRAYQQILLLSRRHSITLLAFAEASEPCWRQEMEACCERVVAAPRNRIGMVLGALRALAGRRPLQVAMHDGVPRSAGLEALLDGSHFDVAHLQLARLGGLLPRLAGVPCVLDLVDALSLNMARRATFDRGLLGLLARIESQRLGEFERELCTQVAAAAVCSASDRAAIGEFANLHLVANGVDLEHFSFHAPRGRAQRIVFVGNLGYFPNIDAVCWFAREVLPRLAQLAPQARLSLVGARPAAVLHRLAANVGNIDLIGQVPDVHPYLCQAAVAVVPLRAGSGQQLKLLEAMASGTPVVATSACAEAVGARHGEHLLVADEADSMCAAVARLLSDEALGLRLAVAARRLVENNFSWDQSALQLERLWIAAARPVSRFAVQ